jgi:PhnB protein
MNRVTTYIHFDGNCREAMQFYQKCLGTEIQLIPLPDDSGNPSADPAAKIMHSQLLRNGQPILMASDGCPGGTLKAGNNFSVSVDCESIAEIERLFAAIGKNGHVICCWATCGGVRASACSPINSASRGCSTAQLDSRIV